MRWFNKSYQKEVSRKKWNLKCSQCIHLGRTISSIGRIVDSNKADIVCQLDKCNYRIKK